MRVERGKATDVTPLTSLLTQAAPTLLVFGSHARIGALLGQASEDQRRTEIYAPGPAGPGARPPRRPLVLQIPIAVRPRGVAGVATPDPARATPRKPSVDARRLADEHCCTCAAPAPKLCVLSVVAIVSVLFDEFARSQVSRSRMLALRSRVVMDNQLTATCFYTRISVNC